MGEDPPGHIAEDGNGEPLSYSSVDLLPVLRIHVAQRSHVGLPGRIRKFGAVEASIKQMPQPLSGGRCPICKLAELAANIHLTIRIVPWSRHVWCFLYVQVVDDHANIELTHEDEVGSIHYGLCPLFRLRVAAKILEQF